MRKTATLCTAALLTVAAGTSVVAQEPSKDHVRSLIAQVMQQQGQAPPVQGVPSVPFRTPGPRLDLSLDEAVRRATDQNIDIAVARITPRLTDFSLLGLEANYRVNMTSTVANTSTTDLPRVTTQGISEPTTSMRGAWSAGIAQNLWRGGGNYTVAWTNSRFDGSSSINIRNPQYQSGVTANLTQPLLRGFKIDSNRAAIQTTRISRENDDISLNSVTATTQANVKIAYWDLVFAIQAVDVAQSSLDIANRLVRDNQARVEIGTLAPIDIVTAQAEEATRRQALVTTQATLRTAELALKRLIVSGTEDPLWTSSINPVDRPSTTPEAIDLEGAVTRALRDRTDLAQSKNNLRISDINLRNQVDLTRPQLNVQAAYGLAGLGGPILQQGTIIPSGYFDALRNISGFDAPTWTVGLNFAYPLGRSAQEANVARSKLSIDQTRANLKSLELQIATEVTTAALLVQSSLESVQAGGVARELAQKRLEAAQSKFEVGMSTNFEVVQAQRDFTEARNNELRAILAYRRALVNFETSQTVGGRGIAAGVAGGAGGGGAVSAAGTGGTGGQGGQGQGGQ